MREFKDCYIAFLDILGFKEILKSPLQNKCEVIAGYFDRIQEEYNITIDSTGEPLIQLSAIHQKIMSDSICFYVEASETNALAGLVAVCDYFQVRMARQQEPILIRGAIVQGELYADGDIVFGNGFVNAYLMEENTAKYPRIILTKHLIKHAISNNSYGEDYIKQFTFEDEDSFFSLDYLYLFYGLRHEHSDWKQFASKVFERIDEETNASIREKYLYIRRNIDRDRKKFMDNEGYKYA